GGLSSLLHPPRAHCRVPRRRPGVHAATIGPRKDIGAERDGGPRGAAPEGSDGPSRVQDALGRRAAAAAPPEKDAASLITHCGLGEFSTWRRAGSSGKKRQERRNDALPRLLVAQDPLGA